MWSENKGGIFYKRKKKKKTRNGSLDGIWLFRDDKERKEEFLLHHPRVCFVDYKESVLHIFQLSRLK